MLKVTKKKGITNRKKCIDNSLNCAVYRDNCGVCNWSTVTSILDLDPFFPRRAGRLRQIQNGVRFLGVQEQQSDARHSIQSARIMASASTMNRVSCGRDLNCVPEIADTLAAVAKLGWVNCLIFLNVR